MAHNTQFTMISQLALPRVGGFGGLNPNDYQNHNILVIFELYLVARSLWFRYDKHNWFDTIAWNHFRIELPAFELPQNHNARAAKGVFKRVRDQTQESFFTGIITLTYFY